jgi:hypothetical protein
MPLPNFLIIGAPKTGTTALYMYLQEHPAVFMSHPKEPHFFTYKHDQWPEWATPTLAEYGQLFEPAGQALALGEASTWYLYSRHAAQAIQRQIPSVRLIALVRHPVDRAYSSFTFRQQCGWEDLPTFEQAIRQEPERIAQAMPWDYHYLQAGFYGEQLQRYYDTFDRSQIRVFLHDDLKSDAAAVVRSTCQFLEIDEGLCLETKTSHNITYRPKSKHINHFLTHNSGLKSMMKRSIPAWVRRPLANQVRRQNLVKPAPLDPDLRQRLTRFFREDILQLQDLIDRDLSSWLAP